jgi:HKD family nuclease
MAAQWDGCDNLAKDFQNRFVMTLNIQDPTNPNSDYLVDTLLDACVGASRGGGAFAFLSSGGVKLLLQDNRFIEFSKSGAFDLVVGVDAITDTNAIAALDVAKASNPGLSTCVHVPSHPRSIFHPKFAWFETPDGGTLVAGSGNLTAGGLRWNIEAYSVSKLTSAEVKSIANQWADFKKHSAECLLATDDPKVIAILERNALRKKLDAKDKPRPEAVPGVPLGALPAPLVNVEAGAELVDVIPPVKPDTEVLVAQISGSGNRWKQANFHLDKFINFFGASMTVARSVYLFQVRADGTVGNQEVRPAVKVASANYRFELDAASGLAYPEVGRPIGVFVKIATRTFTYMLIMPGDDHHQILDELLKKAIPNPGRMMRQHVFSAQEVIKSWSKSPLWQVLEI